MAKRADSPYRAGARPTGSSCARTAADDFVIVGFTRARRAAAPGFGALHLAAFDDGDARLLRPRRAAASTRSSSSRSARALEARPSGDARLHGAAAGRARPRLGRAAARGRGAVHSWTDEGLLRQPVFQRLRDDKRPEECRCASARHPRAPPEPGRGRRRRRRRRRIRRPDDGSPGRRRVPFTNLGKVFWPEEGYTKGDLIEYYRRSRPGSCPYLGTGLLVLTRYPDGIAGKSFFQKDAPGFAPGWVRTERVWSEDARARDRLLRLRRPRVAPLHREPRTIPLHVWASRVTDLAHPDWCILDLDPKGAPFAHVVAGRAGRPRRCATRSGCRRTSKTSGSTGLHVLVPARAAAAPSSSAGSSGSCSRRVVAARASGRSPRPSRLPSGRGGRVYIDFLQNGHGKLLAAPFTARPVPGRPSPRRSSGTRWTRRSTPRASRSARSPSGCPPSAAIPWRRSYAQKPDLVTALARLSARLEG